MVQTDIKKLVLYGVQTGLVPREDVVYTTNRLLELFRLDELEEVLAGEGTGTEAGEKTGEASGAGAFQG